MVKKKVDKCCDWGSGMCKDSCNSCGYFLGFVGAAVYYISNAAGFWAGVVGLLKAAVWPAFLVHALLSSLGM